MRILTVHNLPPHHPRAGGGQRVTADLARALSRAGHAVHSLHLTTDRESLPFPPDEAPGVEAGVEVHAVPSTGRLLSDAWRAGRAARSLIRKAGIEAVHGSSPEAGGVALFLPGGVGLVGQSHHPDPPDLTAIPPLLRFPSRLAWLRHRQSALLERTLLRRAHRVVAVTRWGRDALLRRGYLDGARSVAVIPNGLADDWFRDDAGSHRRGSPRLLFLGRLDAQKGLDVLLRAMAMLLRDGQEGAARPTLDVLGDGPDRSVLEARTGELGISGAVTFHGHVTPTAIREALADATALVAPSRWELFGLVLLEAMAASVPVVASSVGGIPEVVGEAGLLVEPEDPAALAEALGRLIDDEILRHRLSRDGRERAERFRWERIVPAVEEQLERAVAAAV